MILDANARFLALVGYRLEDIRGQHHRMFYDRVMPPARNTQPSGVPGTGPVQHATFHQLAKSGRIIWLEASYFPVRQADGQVVKVVKLASDVTDSHLPCWKKPPCSPR